jgi:NAD(P)-dependent dehydrogenase (short-subunit alcohol dehydrogenase family)
MNKKVVSITGTNSGFGWLTAKSVSALGHCSIKNKTFIL